MVVTSELRTHKVMETAIRELMGAGTPPRFKFQNTYASIEFPAGYTVPAQATLEAKYNELLALEEDIQKIVIEGDMEVGTANLFVDTETGRVGIGTTNSQDILHLYGATDSSLRVETNTGQAQLLLRAGETDRRACRVDFSRADTGSQYAWIIGDYQQDATDDLTIGTSGGGRIMTFTQNGRAGIGKVNPAYKLDVTGDIYATGNIIAYSDKRAKSDIQKIENALDKIEQLNGYTFTMNDKRYTGVIAQEVLSVLPEAVTGSEETNYAVAYGNMMGLMIEAIKELKKKVEQQ